MRHRSTLVALLPAVLMAAGGLVGCEREPSSASGDPRVEGVLPHPLPAADTSILAAPSGGRRPTTPAPAKPTPATAAATDSAPAADTQPASAPGPESASPATAPATSRAGG